MHAVFVDDQATALALFPTLDTAWFFDPESAELLHATIENDNPALLALLLPYSQKSLCVRNTEGHTPLFDAITQDRIACAELLVSGSDPQSLDAQGNTPLMLAAFMGAANLTRSLLPLTKNPQTQNADGLDALMLAVQGESMDCVRALLPASNARAVSRHGADALLTAIFKKNADLVAMLAPLSNIGRKNIAGEDRFQTALSLRAWSCVDAMAEHVDPARADEALEESLQASQPNESLMPRWAGLRRAQREAEALAGILSAEKTRGDTRGSETSEPATGQTVDAALARRPRSI